MLHLPHYKAIYKAILDLTEAQRPVNMPGLLSLYLMNFEGQGPTASIIAA